MIRVLLVLFLLASCNVNAQFALGNTTTSFTDIARSNRQISCEIFYPASSSGPDAPIADGMFPYIVFGHGFVMNYTAYETLANALVSSGYVLIFVETEGGFAPSHSAYGLDLAYVADHFFADNSTSSAGIFQNHLLDRCGIMGHSMGGGATWLASTTSASVDCIAGLAPAETNPSAIAAATNATVPAIVFSGSNDAVTAPANNHIPIFEGTVSACRIFVNILEGSHCGYADSGSLCDFGELGFSGLSREEQQTITHDLLLAYFDFHLKEMATGNAVLQSYDSTQSNVDMLIECLSSVTQSDSQGMLVFPNPCAESLFLESDVNGSKTYSVMDLTGREVVSGLLMFSNRRAEVSTVQLPAGVYSMLLDDQIVARFLKR
jgi:dienelactone hydrolase